MENTENIANNPTVIKPIIIKAQLLNQKDNKMFMVGFKELTKNSTTLDNSTFLIGVQSLIEGPEKDMNTFLTGIDKIILGNPKDNTTFLQLVAELHKEIQAAAKATENTDEVPKKDFREYFKKLTLTHLIIAIAVMLILIVIGYSMKNKFYTENIRQGQCFGF